jgi:hypothetical protein
MPIKGGYSAFSGGPILDTTPKDFSLSNRGCGIGVVTDAGMENTPYGPPYQIPVKDSVPEDKKEK